MTPVSNSDGIILSLEELLVLLDAVGADELIGVDSDALLPDTREEHAKMVRAGIEQLKERGLLNVVDEVHVINSELLMVGQIFAHPQLALLIRKDVPDLGEQLFLYYQREQYIIEHTRPEPEQFRFATIPNTLALLNRIEFVLPVQDQPPAADYRFSIEQEFYLGSQWLAQRGQVEEAATVLQEQGFSAEAAQDLAGALESHDFAGAIAMLQIHNGATTDAREMAVIQADGSAWIMSHQSPGGEQVVLQTADLEQFRVQLFELLRDLVRQP